jgi:RNA polymerase-associated protein LEO1
MVRWSDGSFSLLLGDELFEVATQDLKDQHQYLLLSHPKEGLFQTHARFMKSATFRPHNTQSLTHKKLTLAMYVFYTYIIYIIYIRINNTLL